MPRWPEAGIASLHAPASTKHRPLPLCSPGPALVLGRQLPVRREEASKRSGKPSGPGGSGQVGLAPQLEGEKAPQSLGVILLPGDVLRDEPGDALGGQQTDAA